MPIHPAILSVIEASKRFWNANPKDEMEAVVAISRTLNRAIQKAHKQGFSRQEIDAAAYIGYGQAVLGYPDRVEQEE